MEALKAFLFGIAVAIAIGPIAILVITNGITHGFAAAMRSAGGAASADLTFSLVAFSIGAQLNRVLDEHQALFALLSSVVLILFGLWMIRNAGFRNPAGVPDAAARSARVFGYWPTYGLTAANPLTIVAFMGFAGQASYAGAWYEIAYFSFFVFLGSLLVQTMLALFSSSLRSILKNPRIVAYLNLAGGAAIATFGIVGVFGAI
ncbi:MAG: LysE family translocator [Candidatus Krumholzibacteriia bacterium]